MNANELADELVWIAKNRGDSISRQLADIVRQQQAEIEALKEELDKQGKIIPFTESEIKYSKPQFPDKPVGWWDGNPKNVIGISKTKECEDWLPLYTHPVKELTDEEVHQAIRRGFARDGFLSDGIFLEIKELLRKAQEK